MICDYFPTPHFKNGEENHDLFNIFPTRHFKNGEENHDL